MKVIQLKEDRSNVKEMFDFMRTEFFKHVSELSNETFLFKPVGKLCERIIIETGKLSDQDVYMCLTKCQKKWAKAINVEYQLKKAVFPELIKEKKTF